MANASEGRGRTAPARPLMPSIGSAGEASSHSLRSATALCPPGEGAASNTDMSHRSGTIDLAAAGESEVAAGVMPVERLRDALALYPVPALA